MGAAFLVSFAVWPVRLVDTLRTDIGAQFRECARLLDEVAQSFLTTQHYIPTDPLDALEARVWENHERLLKARKHESLLFGYEHGIMEVQVSALDRAVECLRTMTEALNDYQEESYPLPISHEMRNLADAVMAALRQLGSDTPALPVPDLIRGLTFGVDYAETRLAELRLRGITEELPLHKLLQFFTFYQAMRLLSERLLLAFDRLQRFRRA